jgi:S-adenosylmethionine hydrolase
MARSQLVTLLTDFGWQDVYVAVMKGVIANINPQISVIDLTHQIPPQDLIAGRFALLNAYAYFPHGTVHVAVIDPGVGSQRRGIAIQLAGGFLVGADNGLFSGILPKESAIAAVELTNNNYWRSDRPSTTFHGRDIFAPVGAHLANGVSLKELGKEIAIDSLVGLSLPEVTIKKNQIIGCIQYIDRFGNLITNITAQNLQFRQQVIIKQQSIPWGNTYSDGKDRELIALIGSHGYLEIAVNCGNAKEKLQVIVGETVVVRLLEQ